MGNDQQHRVHVIDDSKDMQALLRLILENNGCQVDCSSNGEEALDHLTAALNSQTAMPHVILLDSMMPVMSGKEFLIARRENSRLKEVPVILMTGEEEAAFHDETSKQETCEFLKKPFHLRDVMDVVRKHSLLS